MEFAEPSSHAIRGDGLRRIDRRPQPDPPRPRVCPDDAVPRLHRPRPARADRILGFTAFGVEAGEVMAVVPVAMTAGMPYTELRDAVLTHPTIAEGLTLIHSEALADPGAPTSP